MRLYIIRHADPDYERNTLTPAGHLEAQALARRLASHGLDHLYTSPLGRARHTAQYAADLLKIEPMIEEWTQEIPNWRVEVEGWGPMPMWDVPGELLRAQPYPTFETWHTMPFWNAATTQEYFASLKAHSDEFLARHGYARAGRLYRCERSNGAQVAVFCHQGFGLTWLAYLLDIPPPMVWGGFWIAPSSVTTVLFEERSQNWAAPRCLSIGDVGHLYEARLPVQPRGLRGNLR